MYFISKEEFFISKEEFAEKTLGLMGVDEELNSKV